MKYSIAVLFVSLNSFAAQMPTQHERPTQFSINGHFIEIDGEDPQAFGHWSDDDVEVLSGYLKEVLSEKASAQDLRQLNRAIHVQVSRGLEFERSVKNHRGYTHTPALTEYHLYISAIASGEQVKTFLREQFEDLPEPLPITREVVRQNWCQRLLTKALERFSSGED
jgi:hypothetical protein